MELRAEGHDILNNRIHLREHFHLPTEHVHHKLKIIHKIGHKINYK